MAVSTLPPGSQTNGHSNGTTPSVYTALRFSDIPLALDIPVNDGDEVVNLDLTSLLDETDELCDLLEAENAAKTYWITIALAYAKQNNVNVAIDVLQKGLRALSRGKGDDRLSVLACLCWLYLWKCRHAPRIAASTPAAGKEGEDERLKDAFLGLATSTLNDAARINPQYPPLALARGTLYLLRASLQPTKSSSGSTDTSERAETLKQAAKCFDEAYRLSGQTNVLAILGKAKAQFSLSRHAEALALYQQALALRPDLLDPDPRIGIGCCLWALNHKTLARSAWQRSLDLHPESQTAHILLGLSYLDESNGHPTTSPEFAPLYKKAMTAHTQTAFKLSSGMHALTCATFGSYFLLRKTWPNVERLARRAIEHTDVNAVASDGWYLLARKEHYAGDISKAADYYNKADQARGGDERGFVPAKFGVAQCRVLEGDLEGGKFRLEKLISGTIPGGKSAEALTLLGVLYAEEVYASQSQTVGGAAAAGKEDTSLQMKKAIGLLEQVRVMWKDAKKALTPDVAVLLNLARLYEAHTPEKALACLMQVEQIELDEIADDDDRLPDDVGDEAEERRCKRELLSPQLLNNIGCFHFTADHYTLAREDFQTALNACVKMGERDPEVDTDGLVTTLSYNLARTYEAEGLNTEAQKVYQGLLDRHPSYIDASMRLAYLLLEDPDTASAGGETLKSLLEAEPSNLELRALYAWYLSSHKRGGRPPSNLADDPLQKFHKQTLQTYDKHDLYSLIGMGNLHLAVAREMRRETDQDKEKRSKVYTRAVEFYDKVLALDKGNAWAGMGLGIAVVEERRSFAEGIQIFSKVRESVKGGSAAVYANLGHVFAEVRQWGRSVENYELALARAGKGGGVDQAQTLSCLARVWLLRGRQEKGLEAYKTSLELSRQALLLSPETVALRFNVAFVRIQLAQLLISLPEAQRSLLDLEQAAKGLDEAIDAFGEIARGPNPPFPRGDLEARASMGRNTMVRQLRDAIGRQAEYEKKNASRLEEAKKRREDEAQRRQAEKAEAARVADEARLKVREERERMAEEEREERAKRLQEDLVKEQAGYTTDENGERRKREKKVRVKGAPGGGKRKKKGEETDGEPGTQGSGSEASDGDTAAPRKKKKRRLEKRGQAGVAAAAGKGSKFKSSEMVEDSSGGEDAGGNGTGTQGTSGAEEEGGMEVDGEEEVASRPSRKKVGRVVDEEDEDEDDDGEGAAQGREAALKEATKGDDVVAAGSASHGGGGTGGVV